MDTFLKRLGALNVGRAGAVLPLADGAAGDRIGEREALLGVYPFSDVADTGPPPPAPVHFSGLLVAQSALVTGFLQVISRSTVKQVPRTRTVQVPWSDLVRQAEGADWPNRGRYAEYTFGSGRRTRNFWGNTDGT